MTALEQANAALANVARLYAEINAAGGWDGGQSTPLAVMLRAEMLLASTAALVSIADSLHTLARRPAR